MYPSLDYQSPRGFFLGPLYPEVVSYPDSTRQGVSGSYAVTLRKSYHNSYFSGDFHLGCRFQIGRGSLISCAHLDISRVVLPDLFISARFQYKLSQNLF